MAVPPDEPTSLGCISIRVKNKPSDLVVSVPISAFG